MNDETFARIGDRVGDYEILGVLGAGGMGKVYKVRNVISDRVEAMKVLLPDLADRRALADRFLREIKLLATLNHPNIAALRTALTWENQLVMIMEYVEGVTLSALLKRGPLAPAVAIDYMSQVLSALAYAHSLHIVHRDIKPANMMLTQQGVVKLMDFGIARSQSDPVLTQSGSTLGSLQYMSPEQVRGESADERSDLYSIGVSLYEMCTGQRPFRADNEYAVMLAHLQTPPPPPIDVRPDLPVPLNDIVLMAMAKEPAQRFQSATAMRNALQSLAVGLSESQPASPVPDAPVPLAGSARAEDATGTCASPPSDVIRAALRGSEDNRTPISASAGGNVAASAPSSPAAVPSAAIPVTAPSSPAGAPSNPPAQGVDAVPIAAPPPQQQGQTPSASQQAPSPFGDLPPLPPRAPSHRGLYVALGSVIVLVVLVAAGLYVPRMSRAHAGGDARAIEKPIKPPVPPIAGSEPASANSAAAANSMPAVPPVPEVHAPAASGNAVSSSAPDAAAPQLSASSHKSAPRSAERGPATRASAANSPMAGRTQSDQQVALNRPPADVPPPSAANNNLEELEHDADLLASRVDSVDASLEGLRQGQAAQGLGLRGDIASSQQRMRTYMARAQSALKNHDAENAKKYLTLTDTEVSSLEKFLGH